MYSENRKGESQYIYSKKIIYRYKRRLSLSLFRESVDEMIYGSFMHDKE